MCVGGGGEGGGGGGDGSVVHGCLRAVTKCAHCSQMQLQIELHCSQMQLQNVLHCSQIIQVTDITFILRLENYHITLATSSTWLTRVLQSLPEGVRWHHLFGGISSLVSNA